MKKITKLLLGILIITTTFALPAQAAINIGVTAYSSGNVIHLNSYFYPKSGSVTVSTPTQTQTPSSQTQTTTTSPHSTSIQTNTTGSNVISLRNILNQNYGTKTTTQTTTTTPNTNTTTPSPSTLPIITALTPDEQAMMDMVNQERINAGLQPLKVDLRLASVARAKANDMLVNNYFDHTSPTYGSPWAMMQQVGVNYKWAGENLAGNRSVSAAMAAFMQSPGHRANILDPRFTHIGIGISTGGPYGNYFVQEFAQE